MKRNILLFAIILMAYSTGAMAADGLLVMSGGGDGTVGTPYKIANYTDLATFRTAINTGTDLTAYVELSANITATGTWGGIGTSTNYFKGSLDGKGYTISGLTNAGITTGPYGFLNYAANGTTIKNLNLSDIYYLSSGTVGMSIGGLIGSITVAGTVTIDNCYVSGTINSTVASTVATTATLRVAGLVGQNGPGAVACILNITNCSSNVNITATSNSTATNGTGRQVSCGGILGDSPSATSFTIVNCFTSGTISASSVGNVYAGGIMANNSVASSKIYNCYSSMTIDALTSNLITSPSSVFVGGIAGSWASGSEIKNCIALNTHLQARTANSATTNVNVFRIAGGTLTASAALANYAYANIELKRSLSWTGDISTGSGTTTTVTPTNITTGKDGANTIATTAPTAATEALGYLNGALSAYSAYNPKTWSMTGVSKPAFVNSISFATKTYSKTVGDGIFIQTPTVTSSSVAITYASNATGVAMVDNINGFVSVIGVGTARITASLAAAGSYTETSDYYDVTVVAGVGVNASHPYIWASTAEKAQITSNIVSYPWASSIYVQLKSRVDAKKDAHKLNPETILSTIPSLTGTDRTGQTEMLNTAAESAILYYLTDNADYAQLAADILSSYTDKLALVDTVNTRKAYFFGDWWLESRTTYPRIPIIYDFVYNFVNNPNNTVYDLATHSRKKFNNTVAQTAVKKLAANDMRSITATICNHSVLAGNGALLNILMIDNDVVRESYFNRYYYDPSNKLPFDAFTWTLANFSTQDIWPETISYGKISQEIVLQAMNIIDRIKPQLNIVNNNLRVLDGSYKYADFYFPSGAAIRYGDSHRDIDRISIYQRILAIATRKNLPEYIAKAKQVLKYEYGLVGGYKPIVATETLEWYGPLELLWGVNIANSVVPVAEPVHQTVSIEHAGIVLQRNNNTTDSINYGLMYTTGGATYIHAHATGIDMELYGNGNVLGVNNGTGDYTPAIHTDYEIKYAAHNTVIVNSSAKEGPLNSWADVMCKVTLDASEPAPDDVAVSKDFLFSTQSLNDTYNNCLQERTVGMIRTSDISGYYLDVFRSKSNGTNNYHDYIYHNIGDTVTMKFTNNAVVPLSSSARYSNDITGSVSGWKYFSKVISSNATTNAINALFPLNTVNKYMNVFMPSGVSREYSTAVAPPTYEAENNYYKKNTPVMTIRQYGEAWDRPFICAFEPSTTTSPTIQSVAQLMNGTKVVGAKVISIVNGITITDWVISQEAANLTYTNSADAISFTGRFGIVRTSVQNKVTKVSLYIGEGSSLQFNDNVLVANSKNNGWRSFDVVTSTINTNSRLKLSISPTVTSGIISINAGTNEQVKYAIFNLTGICLKKGIAINNTIIDLSQLPSGTYFAQLIGNSQNLSQKLILNK